MKNIFEMNAVVSQFQTKHCLWETFSDESSSQAEEGGTVLIISPTARENAERDWSHPTNGVKFTLADFRVRHVTGTIFRVYLVTPGDLVACTQEEWQKVNPATETFNLGSLWNLYWATRAEVTRLRPNEHTLKEAFDLLGV